MILYYVNNVDEVAPYDYNSSIRNTIRVIITIEFAIISLALSYITKMV